MVAIADQFISVFKGMYLEMIRYWSTDDPTCTGGFVVCLPWDSFLTWVDTRVDGIFSLDSTSMFDRSQPGYNVLTWRRCGAKSHDRG